MTKKKVLFLTNIPSPYMVGYLNELGKHCILKAVFEKSADSSRPDSWKSVLSDDMSFDPVVLSGIGVSSRLYGDEQGFAPDDKAISLSVIKYLTREYDIIIVGNPCTPTGIISIIFMQYKKIPYTIQSEGGFPGNGKGLKEKLKYILMNKAELFFSTCKLDDEYFIKYGATNDRIRRYNFTSMYKYQMPERTPSDKEKNEMREKLGIENSLLVLTVGRSVPVKGFDVLIKAFKNIDNEVKKSIGKDCCLYLVGAEETPEYHDIICKEKINGVHFVENVPFEKLREYYIAADIFVLPTRGDTWGLVINEAMAYGLPIVCTDKCVAADALLVHGKGGFIVKVDDVEALREAIICLLADSKTRACMGDYNFAQIKDNTLEQMGLVMSDHIEEYCSEFKNH